MEGARSADHEEAVIVLLEDFDGFFAAFEDCGEGVFWGWDLGGQELRRNQRVVADDYSKSVLSSLDLGMWYKYREHHRSHWRRRWKACCRWILSKTDVGVDQIVREANITLAKVNGS